MTTWVHKRGRTGGCPRLSEVAPTFAASRIPHAFAVRGGSWGCAKLCAVIAPGPRNRLSAAALHE